MFGLWDNNTPSLQSKSTGVYSQTKDGYYSTISHVLGVPEKMFYLSHLPKTYLFVFKYYGFFSSFFLSTVFVLFSFVFLKEIFVQVKLAYSHFRVLKTQHDYHQNITKMLVLLPLASSHNCIHTIFQIIGNQEQLY